MNTRQKAAIMGAGFVSKGDAKPANATIPAEFMVQKDPASSQAVTQTAPVQGGSPLESDATTPSVPSTQQLHVQQTVATQSSTTSMGTKSITVKVDGQTYDRLKNHGFMSKKTNQNIFTEALAMYFKAKNI